jgi:glycine/D-amino acid oxidase-like deaminating enzyme
MKPAEAPPATAIVAGGGIIGLACALQLQARGIATLMVNDGGSRPASWGNAGHIAVEQVEPLASLNSLASLPRRLFALGGAVALPPREFTAWLPFTWRLACASFPDRFERGKAAMAELLSRAVPAWRRLAIRAMAGDCLVEDGHYVVWETEKTARRGRAHWRQAEIGTAGIRDLTSAEAAQIAGLVARAPVDGLRFTGTARVRDPGELLTRLAGAFEKARGERIDARIECLALDDSHASLMLANGERLEADLVVMAAGAGSARLLRPMGIDVPLIAERGYHIQAEAPAWPDLPPVVFEDRSMIVSRFNSGLRAASFVEFAREDSAPDPRKWQRLRRHAAELDLPFSSVAREWMGARPTLPDYLPAIGRSRRAGNLVYAFGHQHLGLTLAAITGELVAALAMRETPEVDLTPFDIDRF